MATKVYCIQTQWCNLILSSFQGSTKSLTYTKQRNTLPRYVQLKRISSSIKLQISKLEVHWTTQEWLSVKEFWDVISSPNLYLSQINYHISAGFYSLGIWCEKSKIPFGCSVVRSAGLIHNSYVRQGARSDHLHPIKEDF